jgi:hypothetical protein
MLQCCNLVLYFVTLKLNKCPLIYYLTASFLTCCSKHILDHPTSLHLYGKLTHVTGLPWTIPQPQKSTRRRIKEYLRSKKKISELVPQDPRKEKKVNLFTYTHLRINEDKCMWRVAICLRKRNLQRM